MKKVYITGGTGFIGRQLIRVLSKRNDCDIVMLTRDSSVIEPWLNEACQGRVRCCSLGSVESLEASIEINADVVIHLAATMDFYPNVSAESALHAVNVKGTQNLLRAAEKQRVKRFIYCSSTEAMGPSRADGMPSDESEPCKPSYAYGRTKLEAERAVASLHRRKDAADAAMQCVSLRLSGVYGDDDRFSIFELISMINQGWMFFVPGDGRAQLMYTHVDDVVSAIVHAALLVDRFDDDINPVFNVCPDEPLTYRQWIETLCRLLGRAPPLFSLPLPLCAAVIRILAPPMNIAKRRTFMWHPYTIYRMAEHRCYSNRRARLALAGWAPRYDIETGLERTVAHLIANGHIVRHRFSPLLVVALVFIVFITIFIRCAF